MKPGVDTSRITQRLKALPEQVLPWLAIPRRMGRANAVFTVTDRTRAWR
jgi:hypothetical protein